MRFSIAIASLALLISSCDRETPATPSTPPASPQVSFSQSSDSEPTNSDRQFAAPASGAVGSGNPIEGEMLFNQLTLAAAPGCAACHSLQPGVRMVGPSMADAATVASGAVDGLSAEEFLRQSIVEPDAYITEGFMPGLMPQDYGSTLSIQQIDDLVAFLLTQT